MIKRNMKRIKHIVTITLAMLMCIAATIPVFATGDPPADDGTKTNIKGLPPDFGKGEGFRLIGSNQYGYTISAFFKADGTDVSTADPKQNAFVMVLKTVTSDVGPKTYIPTQSTWENQMNEENRIKYLSDFGGGYIPQSDRKQSISVKGSVNTAIPLVYLNDPLGHIVVDTTYASKSKLGSPLTPGFAERVKTQYELNSQTSEIAEIFKTIALHHRDDKGNYYTDNRAQLAFMADGVMSSLDGAFQASILAVIKSEFPDDADAIARTDLMIDMVLPVSDKCVVGWGILLEPLVYQYVKEGSEKSTLLPDKFNSIMVSASDCAYINGASRAFANNVIGVSENTVGTLKDNADKVIKSVSKEWIKKLSEKGEFAWNLNSISHASLPNSALLEEPWWGMPAKDPKAPWDDIDMSLGAGVGAYKNTRATLKTVEPCCRPARMGTIPLDKCPCTGGKRCGCAGHTCSGPSECDCYTPPLKQGEVFINEEHLSEELSLLLIPKSSEKTFTVAYKPIPTGGDYTDNAFCTQTSNTERRMIPGSCGDPGGHAAFHAGLIPYHLCIPDYETYTTYTTHCNAKAYTWSAPTYGDFRASIPRKYLTQNSLVNTTGDPYKFMARGADALWKLDSEGALLAPVTGSGLITTIGDQLQQNQQVSWISHRYGDPSLIDQVILAEYMTKFGSTKDNTKYATFLAEAGIGKPTEATAWKTTAINRKDGSFDWSAKIGSGGDVLAEAGAIQPADFTILEGALHEISANSTGENSDINAGHNHAGVGGKPVSPRHEANWLETVKLGIANYSAKVGVNKPYYAKSDAVALTTTTKNSVVQGMGGGVNTWTFTSPSRVFEFFPTYQMKADYTIGDGDNKVDMLGTQPRKFQGTDKLLITGMNAGGTITAPWSRDKQDLEAGGDIMKAGNAYEYALGGATIQIDGYVHIQDPAFAKDSASAIAANNSIISQSIGSIKSIINSIGKDDISVYSNLWAASTPGAPISISVPNKIASADATGMRIIAGSASATGPSVNATYLPGINGANTTGRSAAGYGASAGDPLGENGLLISRLEQDGGIDISGWYDEDYEGIIVLHMTATVSVSNIKTDFAAVHSYISDWKTPTNQQAKAGVSSSSIAGNVTAIPAGKFGIGTAVNLGTVGWGTVSAPVTVVFGPTFFGVRGSVFDTVE